MTQTTALYRRYRPDSFADVIGQEHVTEPLMTALRKNRVNHAYLFSGPRGCGKTTSARILARCLNCVQGPTDTPCGVCPSCVELARGGSGSLDVIEIDAASHGGVDDARDLRERATFAPVRDRYKIFIIDEAHMVTSAGFNALLKIVEEPPEHIKFIFATTEPDKVIGTIRSRTHHYPFRLVPPEPLLKYLEQLCAAENVPVAPGVLSLVIRAGGGSVRDSLSVLDQLMAGAGPNGLDYELAVALLGYTHASLLDDVVEAVAAADSATVFRAVDRVIQTGHDPRRFVEDLLERFRDLIIVQAMPESAQAILRGVPEDQIARMRSQAKNLGAAELSRAADVANTALTEMTGATSPRLHLELLCARILLPGSEQTERGLAARIDRVEKRLNYGGAVSPVAAGASESTTAPQPPQVAAAASPAAQPAGGPAAQRSTSVPPTPPPPAAAETPAREQLTAPRVSTADGPVDDRKAAQAPPAASAPRSSTPEHHAPTQQAPTQHTQPRPAAASGQQSSPAGSGADVEVLRRAWPEILQTLAKIKRSTWALVEPNAQVAQFDGQLLTLAFTTPGLAGAFGRTDHSENLRQAIHKTVGIDCQITAVAGGNSSASSEPNPKAPTSRARPAASSVDVEWGLAPASTTADAHAEAPRPTPAVAPALASSEATTRAAAATQVDPAPHVDPAPQADASGQADTANPTDTNGSYSYPDDDWGTPRDEDAPPLDEEPPADWEPSGPDSFVPGSNTSPSTRSGANSGANSGTTKGTPQTDIPAGTLSQISFTADPPAAVAVPERTPATASAGAGGASAAPEDPWSRAIEHAPGTWVVGNGSNVGSTPSNHSAGEHDTLQAQPSPAYEPATAQPPTSGGGWAPSATSAPTSTPASAAPATADWNATSAQPAATPAPVATPQVATPTPAASSPGAARTATVLADHAPAPNGQRQSLYQRLTNSPEALAGRGQAPAPRAVGTTTYAEDVPSADDETIEESRVFGRAAVERILGGKLLEERSLDGSPLPHR